MMLRLVLVGVVAALGVSVPSQPSCEHWFESAQAWTTSLLAEWDTWEPEVEDGPRLVGTPNAIGCEECRLARMRLLASAPETSKAEVIVAAGNGTSNAPDKGPALADSKAGEPRSKANNPTRSEVVGIDEILEWEFLFEVNDKTDEVASAAPTPVVPEDLLAAVDAFDLSGPAELGIWGDFYRVASEPIVADTKTQTDRLLAEEFELFDSDRSCICSFGEFELEERAAPHSPSRPTDAPKSPSVAVAEPVDPTSIWVSCLDEESAFEGDSDPVNVVREASPALAELPSDVFATPRFTVPVIPQTTPAERVAEPPVAVVSAKTGSATPKYRFVLADLPTDLFGPGSEALDQKPLTKDQPLSGAQPLAGAQPPTRRLGDAVELTRRAMSAWVSVLIGPALVDGSRR